MLQDRRLGTSLASASVRRMVKCVGDFDLWRLEGNFSRARVLNEQTLRKILSDNRQTWFGRRAGFAELLRAPDLLAAYRAQLPVATYADFAEPIQRMVAGEANVLCAEPPISFAASSGTTGAAKLLPVTRAQQRQGMAFMAATNHAAALRALAPREPLRKGICLLQISAAAPTTRDGLPIALGSSLGMRRMLPMLEKMWSAPVEVYEISDTPTSNYLQALFGLRERQTQYITATFASIVLQWLLALQSRWDELLTDIAQGSLSENLHLTPAEREKLSVGLVPDPARAAELRQAVAGGFEGFLERVWPQMRYISTVTTGSFAVYLPQLQSLAGSVVLYSCYYGASEAAFGMSLWPERPGEYALAAGDCYYEFIPTSQMESTTPQTVSLADLVPGELYEFVITTRAGLYRYRIGDVIEVTGWHGAAPRFRFSYRRETMLDVSGEKMTEAQIRQALVEVGLFEPDSLIRLRDYSCAVEAKSLPHRYVFYLELVTTPPDLDLASLANHLDQRLSALNNLYRSYRARNTLGAPLIKLVHPATFDRFLELQLSLNPQSNTNQVKIPRYVKDAQRLAFLENMTSLAGQ